MNDASMDAQLVGTLTYSEYKAEIYSTELPGEFRVSYQNPEGKQLEEAPLTGISSYKQRETEITERLKELAGGAAPNDSTHLGDAGEY